MHAHTKIQTKRCRNCKAILGPARGPATLAPSEGWAHSHNSCITQAHYTQLWKYGVTSVFSRKLAAKLIPITPQWGVCLSVCYAHCCGCQLG